MVEREARVEILEKCLVSMSSSSHFELFVLSAVEMCDMSTFMYKEGEVRERCNQSYNM